MAVVEDLERLSVAALSPFDRLCLVKLGALSLSSCLRIGQIAFSGRI
jgi:hypothetical protein